MSHPMKLVLNDINFIMSLGKKKKTLVIFSLNSYMLHRIKTKLNRVFEKSNNKVDNRESSQQWNEYLNRVGNVPSGLPFVDRRAWSKFTTPLVVLAEAATDTPLSNFVPKNPTIWKSFFQLSKKKKTTCHFRTKEESVDSLTHSSGSWKIPRPWSRASRHRTKCRRRCSG